MPKVSVIIPTYNCAKYLLEAMESIFKQTYQDFEIIIVDDGSIDNTKNILEPYILSGKIRYFFQENNGPAAARNKGIKALGKPILALISRNSDLEKFLLQYNQAKIVEYDNIYVISQAIEEFIKQKNEGRLVFSDKPDWITQYSRKNQTLRLSHLMGELLKT